MYSLDNAGNKRYFIYKDDNFIEIYNLNEFVNKLETLYNTLKEIDLSNEKVAMEFFDIFENKQKRIFYSAKKINRKTNCEWNQSSRKYQN